MRVLAGLFSFLSIANFANASGPVNPRDLVGVWRLYESVDYMPDGHVVPYCNGAHGYVIYTASGYVSVALNCGPRVSESEPADVSGRKFFYTGTYRVVGSEVVHFMENASETQLIGTSFTRAATVRGYMLTLEGVNQGQRFTAIWQKVDADALP